MYAIRSYYASSTLYATTYTITFAYDAAGNRISRTSAVTVGKSSKMGDQAISFYENKDRITSYNVCYTKLLRFTRRHINIESLTVSESALKGISKFTIVVNASEDVVRKIVGQIEKHVEVLKAFYHTNSEMISQEIALYKVATEALIGSTLIEQLVRKYNARILEVTKDYTVIEKTGHKEETQEFFEELNQIGVLQFIRSGRVSITRSPIEKLIV